ncbi:MAG: FAD:protein FMN transferase, partial [bacterium]
VTVKPDGPMLEKAAAALKRPQNNVGIPFYRSVAGNSLLGYAAIMDEMGKEQPITFLVAITPDFRVQEVLLLEYRESRGGEVSQLRFLKQYKGKSSKNPIQVGNDIRNITGATLSSNAISFGVKKALVYAELFFGTSGVAPATPREDRTIEETQEHMGTLVKITAHCGRAENCAAAVQSAFDEVHHVDMLMSSYKADSEISTINQNAGIKPVKVSPEILEVAVLARTLWRESGGLFDPTIGPLLALWRFGPGAKKGTPRAVPSEDAISESLKSVGFDKVEIDVQAGTIFLKQARMKLDFGGIAKGYAAAKALAALKQRSVGILHEKGIAGATVAVSGDIAFFGVSESGPWTVGIQHPRDKSKIIGTITLAPGGEGAVSTSGDYEKFFTAGGKRYSHIFNPKTGYPVEGAISATVLTVDARMADGLATALFLTGPDGFPMLKKTPAIATGLFIGINEKDELFAVASDGFPLDPKKIKF